MTNHLKMWETKIKTGSFLPPKVAWNLFDYIYELESRLEWVPVSERLPDEGRYVQLFSLPWSDLYEGKLVNSVWLDDDGDPLDAYPTHWREIGPLPTKSDSAGEQKRVAELEWQLADERQKRVVDQRYIADLEAIVSGLSRKPSEVQVVENTP